MRAPLVRRLAVRHRADDGEPIRHCREFGQFFGKMHARQIGGNRAQRPAILARREGFRIKRLLRRHAARQEYLDDRVRSGARGGGRRPLRRLQAEKIRQAEAEPASQADEEKLAARATGACQGIAAALGMVVHREERSFAFFFYREYHPVSIQSVKNLSG